MTESFVPRAHSLPLPFMGGWIIKETETDIIAVMPMIFNDRVVIMRKGTEQYGYDHGWCYDKGAAAILAALAWDPDTEAEPVGYKKAATGHRVLATGGGDS